MHTSTMKHWGIGIAIVGGLVALFGAGSILLSFLPFMSYAGEVAVPLASSGLWLGFLGGAMMWAGITAAQGLPVARAYAPRGIAVAGGLTVLLWGLAWLLPERVQSAPLFAPLHLGMLLLPSLMLLLTITWIVGRGNAPSWRKVILALSNGLLALVIALPVEVIGLVLSSITVAVLTLLFPGGKAELARLWDMFQQWQTAPPSGADLYAVATSPIVWLTAGLTLAAITPLIEELSKTLLAGVMIWKQPPGLAQAFVLGAACGLGFSLLEGVSNSAFGLGNTMEWSGGLLFRAMAMLMHTLTGGITGLGWVLARRGRRWSLPLLYLLAVGLHSLWNFSALLIVFGGLGTNGQQVVALLGMMVLGSLVFIAGSGVLGLPWWLRRKERPDAPGCESPAELSLG